MLQRPDERLVSRDFVSLCIVGFVYWGSVLGLNPLLAPFIKGELHGSTLSVGIAASSVGAAAIASRRWIGPLGDRRGRKLLLVGGALCAALAIASLLVVNSVIGLWPSRLLLGSGQAAFMVGMTTLAMDLAPAPRRGEAMSLVLMSVHIGGGTGPLLYQWIQDTYSYDVVWAVSAVGLTTGALMATTLRVPRPAAAPRRSSGEPRRKIVHPLGVWPGIVFAIGQIGIIGFLAYVALYAREIGVGNVALVFVLNSAAIALTRLVGSRLPDRLGTARAGTLALGLLAVGLTTVAVFDRPVGLFIGTAVLSAGAAFTFPTFVTAAVTEAADDERAAVVSTFTMFGDISGAFGAFLFGAILSITNYRSALLVCASYAIIAIVMLHTVLLRRPVAKLAPKMIGDVS